MLIYDYKKKQNEQTKKNHLQILYVKPYFTLWKQCSLSPLYCFLQLPTSFGFLSSFLQTDLWGVPGVHSKNWHCIYDLSIMQCTWWWRKLQEYLFGTNSFLELSWLERSGQGERLRAVLVVCFCFVFLQAKQGQQGLANVGAKCRFAQMFPCRSEMCVLHSVKWNNLFPRAILGLEAAFKKKKTIYLSIY